MSIATFINAVALLVGFSGATLIWWVGRHEGAGLPFYCDSTGKILSEIATANARRQSHKDKGMALIAIGFLLQFIALFF